MAPQGMTVGRLLRKEREEKKVSLQSVSQRTRIQVAFLQAIEEDAFELIPSELYVRGFIRSYAKSIHLNPEEILDLYRTQGEPHSNPETEPSSFSNRHLKQAKNHLFDFLTTMAGGTPAYSLGKSVFRPKE